MGNSIKNEDLIVSVVTVAPVEANGEGDGGGEGTTIDDELVAAYEPR